MLMPTQTIRDIYTQLFKDGVLTARDCVTSTHPELKVPNLHVLKCMKSLKSRGYIKQNFCWSHYYWFPTNEGIEYLRDYLHLPPEVVPATLKRAAITPFPGAGAGGPIKPGSGFGRGRPIE